MRILICEDEKQLADILVAMLQYNNYSVDVVGDGVSAVDYIETGNYDGVILDLMMPKLNGIEVLKKIRTAGMSVPVIILSAKSQIEDKIVGLDCGANDYLAKPFDAGELLARIRAMTRKATQNNIFLMMGNATLNVANFELVVADGKIKLPNKEFQILEMLMSRKDAVVSVDKLAERIWGYENEVDITTIWVYISNLRKKLVALSATVQIKVVRGVGYRMEEI
ncbi:response regulator transcription factor [Candidatus Epulonipiscium viviparus]|uniref:response regulator transcription factor n=1 Tax=Candidatus Epulonipiscium viviparus TaxID=420336 RepID=UPI00016C05FB|nr:response regulator transcription factor [Candidatus Epulopiscium viviparus]